MILVRVRLSAHHRCEGWLRAGLSWFFTHVIGDSQFGTLLAGTGAKSSYSAFKLTEQRDIMEMQFQTEVTYFSIHISFGFTNIIRRFGTSIIWMVLLLRCNPCHVFPISKSSSRS
jgi:hypothetical protein